LYSYICIKLQKKDHHGHDPKSYPDRFPAVEQHDDIPEQLYHILCKLLHPQWERRPKAEVVAQQLQQYLITLGENDKDEQSK